MPISSRSRTSPSASRSRAWRNSGRVAGSGFLISLSAASSRWPGSSLNSASRPVTPRIRRRRRLLTFIFFSSFFFASGSGRPLAASCTRYFLPTRCAMTMRPSLRTYSRPLASDSSTSRTRGPPRAPSCSMASAFCWNFLVSRACSAASKAASSGADAAGMAARSKVVPNAKAPRARLWAASRPLRSIMTSCLAQRLLSAEAGQAGGRAAGLDLESYELGFSQLPQENGSVQSDISLALSGMKSDQASPATTSSVSQTTSNWPSSWISPINTGFDR